jgi:hypothetical protein
MRILRALLFTSVAAVLMPPAAAAQVTTHTQPRPGLVMSFDGASTRKLFTPETPKINVSVATKATMQRFTAQRARVPSDRATCVMHKAFIGAGIGIAAGVIAAVAQHNLDLDLRPFVWGGLAAGGTVGIIVGQHVCHQ